MTKAEFTKFMDWAKEQTTSDILNTPDNLSTATDIVKALKEAEYWGYMKAVADRPQGHWTKTDVATYRCSECGKKQIADDINELNFCCCCGSRNKVQMLKGADDE